MSRKLADHGDAAVAEPPVQPEPAAVSSEPRGAPGAEGNPPAQEPHADAQPAGGFAQAERGDAQVLPIGVRPSTPAAPAEPGVLQPASQPITGQPETPETAVTTQPSGVQNQATTNQSPWQSPDAPAAGNPQSVVPQSVVPQTVVSQGVVPQGVQAQGAQAHAHAQGVQAQGDQLQPVQVDPAPGPVRVGNETNQHQQQSTDADARSGNGEAQQGTNNSRIGPAVGRAMQVQAAVTVENVTGQLPPQAISGAQTTLSASATTPAGEAQLPTLTDLHGQDAATTGRVIRGLTAMLGQRGGNMTMRLDPPALGQLRVQMTIARGAVTAEFQPGTAEAQALLDRSLATLRSALESQGLTVERLTVTAPPSSAATRETADDQSQQQQQSARNQSDAGDGRSRGRNDEPAHQDATNRRFSANFAEAFDAATDTGTDDLSDRTGAEAA